MTLKLQQLLNQLLGIWKELGVNQRISVSVGAAVVFLGLLGVGFWSYRTDWGLVYGNLDEAQAAKVVAALEEASVPFKLGQGGRSVYVPQDRARLMRLKLAEKGIPSKVDGMGYEIFDKANFGISDFMQRANFLRAVQGELSRTISQLDEVETARVMLVTPPANLILEHQRKPTASVFVKVRGNSSLTSASVNAIRFLVSASVEGLQPVDVIVVDNQGKVRSDMMEAKSVAGLTTTQQTVTSQFEEHLQLKAEEILAKHLGPGQSIVRVSATLNFDSRETNDERFDPESQATLREEIKDRKNDQTTGAGVGGVPGVTTNTGAETTTVSPGNQVSNTRDSEKNTTREFAVSKMVRKTMEAPGGVVRVSAGVGIAKRFEGTGADRVEVSRTPEELEKLRRLVQSALGIQSGPEGTRKDEITLEEVVFTDPISADVVVEQQKQEKTQFWLEIARQGVYPILALGILILFVKMLKKTQIESIPLGRTVGQLSRLGDNTGPTELDPGTGWPTTGKPQVVTVGVLNQLLRENPENMTQALKNWMASSAPGASNTRAP